MKKTSPTNGAAALVVELDARSPEVARLRTSLIELRTRHAEEARRVQAAESRVANRKEALKRERTDSVLSEFQCAGQELATCQVFYEGTGEDIQSTETALKAAEAEACKSLAEDFARADLGAALLAKIEPKVAELVALNKRMSALLTTIDADRRDSKATQDKVLATLIQCDVADEHLPAPVDFDRLFRQFLYEKTKAHPVFIFGLPVIDEAYKEAAFNLASEHFARVLAEISPIESQYNQHRGSRRTARRRAAEINARAVEMKKAEAVGLGASQIGSGS